ncbi:AAA family ATPase [Luteolibacter luteus]|uniref:AAA family ATPase n=1 Tax=Luteolibacter luteus TaxID=2728835 RepID=A0A858RI17_9BACT|nr:AAA family ATPase [Luteolibacter luteus]QJE96492.1 AAA family ATPase [Luteolibacter luteus]
MLRSLDIRGYRSLREFRLRPGRVTVITGQNGVGKSNFYRALALLQRMADGRLAEAIALEGGMPSLMWAGRRRKDEPHRVRWELEHEDFTFEMECGLPAIAPGAPPQFMTKFRTDPDIKMETLRFGGEKGRLMAKRKGPAVELRTPDGKMEHSPLPFHAPESMLSEVRDGLRFPALTATREILLGWRFYHQFRTDPDSSMRRPRVGAWSSVLAHDGSNLAANLQSIREAGYAEIIDKTVEEAFPGADWRCVDDNGGFQLQLRRPDLKRWLDAAELSDGTLRFFCLAAALRTPKPPPLLVLNEPETSLHPGLLSPLADLIAKVPKETQIIIVTHSQALADAISEKCDAKVIELIHHEDETRRAEEGGAKRAWTFEG